MKKLKRIETIAAAAAIITAALAILAFVSLANTLNIYAGIVALASGALCVPCVKVADRAAEMIEAYRRLRREGLR